MNFLSQRLKRLQSPFSKKGPWSDRISDLFILFGGLFMLLSIVGGIRNYSSVPFGDMWDGYLDFYMRTQDGDMSAWWDQHNEHRIILSRLLFWMDLHFFHGTAIFLIIINYLLAGLIFFIFFIILRSMLPEEENKRVRYILSTLILMMSFSWGQYENFTWGFQSQFFLAYLLPLSGFYLIYLSRIRPGGSPFFFACLLGIASAGTMANGVMTLPIMTLLAVILRLGWKKIVVLFFLSSSVLFLYFHHYVPPTGHGSLKDSLMAHPLDFLRYILIYLGGPFSYIFGERGFIPSELAGIFLIGSSVFFTYKAMRNISQSSLVLSILAFLLYIGGTAFGTAGGRLLFGLAQALSSRYTTPALAAWSSLIILYSPIIARKFGPERTFKVLFLLAIPLFLLPEQFKAIQSKEDVLFERNVAVIALNMGINDKEQIGTVFPSASVALDISRKAIRRDLSIFDKSRLKTERISIGHRWVDSKNGQLQKKEMACQGSVEKVTPLKDEKGFLRIEGWFYNPILKKSPENIVLLDSQEKIVGYAMTGKARADVAKAISKKAFISGFKGYLLIKEQGAVTLRDSTNSCRIETRIKTIIPFFIQKATWKVGDNLASIETIENKGNEWRGKDFSHTIKHGYVIMGSFINSDKDTGSIVLDLKRGDSVYYRSGPTTGKEQVIIVGHENEFNQTLPAATEWVKLEFSNSNLPERFSVRFSDQGTTWGEWSAIALKR